MEIRIAHALTAVELTRRMLAAAQQHDVDFEPTSDGVSGVLAKDAGFLGKVRAEYTIESLALVVRVTECPNFLSEDMLRHMMLDELNKLVAS